MSKKFKFKSEKPKEKWKIFSCGDEISAGAIKNPHLELFGRGVWALWNTPIHI